MQIKPSLTFPRTLLVALLLLAGCQNQTALQQDAAQLEAEPVLAIAEPERSPVKPFTKEGLYQLLVAEMAGMRGDFKLALANYVQQAIVSRDLTIIERALRIASYMNARSEQLQLAALWMEVDPDNLEAHHMLAQGLASAGQLLEALPHALFCLERNDSEPLFTLTIMAANINKQDRNLLLQEYPALRQQYPDSPEISLSQAMLLRQQGEIEQALLAVRQSLQLDASSETANLLAAQLLHQQGKKTDALAQLQKALALLPSSKRLRIQQVRFIAEDNLHHAKTLLEDLAAQFPADADLSLTLAAVNKELGLDSEAKAMYVVLIDNPDAAPTAHFQLGLIAEEEGNLEAALLHYRQVHAGPNFFAATVRAVQLLAQHGQLETARLYLNKLRTEIPQLAARLFQVESELLIQFQKSEDAYQVLTKALNHFPNNISLLYTRSMVGDKLQEHAQSEKDLRAILAVDKDNAMALNALGYTLTLHSNRYQEAHQLILRALEQNPDDPATLDSLGWVLYHLGQHQEALVHLRKAYTSLPDPEVAAHLGEVLWVTGAKEEARKIWEQSLSENPQNSIILDTIKRLSSID